MKEREWDTGMKESDRRKGVKKGGDCKLIKVQLLYCSSAPRSEAG